jgi:hypothetical protein
LNHKSSGPAIFYPENIYSIALRHPEKAIMVEYLFVLDNKRMLSGRAMNNHARCIVEQALDFHNILGKGNEVHHRNKEESPLRLNF